MGNSPIAGWGNVGHKSNHIDSLGQDQISFSISG